jgi:hypothetical protein
VPPAFHLSGVSLTAQLKGLSKVQGSVVPLEAASAARGCLLPAACPQDDLVECRQAVASAADHRAPGLRLDYPAS